MMKHRRLLWSLGLVALLGLSAREANAAPMSLTVLLNGSAIYSTSGTNQAVTADTGVLNSDLAGTAYTFSSLSGSSNFPGTSTVVGAFISVAGKVTSPPATGPTTDILKVIVNEGGFMLPTSAAGNTLTSAATSNYSGTGAGTTTPTPSYTQFLGSFTDANSVTTNTPLITQPSNGTASDSHNNSSTVGLGSYVVPFSLSSTTTIQLNVAPNSTSPSNDVFTGKTSVLAVPEPASLVMMVTGMPLPLVVMGLLRRRRGTA